MDCKQLGSFGSDNIVYLLMVNRNLKSWLTDFLVLIAYK